MCSATKVTSCTYLQRLIWLAELKVLQLNQKLLALLLWQLLPSFYPSTLTQKLSQCCNGFKSCHLNMKSSKHNWRPEFQNLLCRKTKFWGKETFSFPRNSFVLSKIFLEGVICLTNACCFMSISQIRVNCVMVNRSCKVVLSGFWHNTLFLTGFGTKKKKKRKKKKKKEEEEQSLQLGFRQPCV